MLRATRGERDPFTSTEITAQRFLKYTSRILLASGVVLLGAKHLPHHTAEPAPSAQTDALATPATRNLSVPSATTIPRALTLGPDKPKMFELPTSTTTIASTITTKPSSIKAQTVPSQPIPQEPEPKPAYDTRSHLERCQAAIADARTIPAPGYTRVCGPESMYETKRDGDMCPLESEADPTGEYGCEVGAEPGQVRYHGDKKDSHTYWVEEIVEHEDRHTWCIHLYRNYTEECANNKAITQS